MIMMKHETYQKSVGYSLQYNFQCLPKPVGTFFPSLLLLPLAFALLINYHQNGKPQTQYILPFVSNHPPPHLMSSKSIFHLLIAIIFLLYPLNYQQFQQNLADIF